MHEDRCRYTCRDGEQNDLGRPQPVTAMTSELQSPLGCYSLQSHPYVGVFLMTLDLMQGTEDNRSLGQEAKPLLNSSLCGFDIYFIQGLK